MQWTVGRSWNNTPCSIARVVQHKPRERSSVVKARNTAPTKSLAVGGRYLQFLKNLIQNLAPLMTMKDNEHKWQRRRPLAWNSFLMILDISQVKFRPSVQSLPDFYLICICKGDIMEKRSYQ